MRSYYKIGLLHTDIRCGVEMGEIPFVLKVCPIVLTDTESPKSGRRMAIDSAVGCVEHSPPPSARVLSYLAVDHLFSVFVRLCVPFFPGKLLVSMCLSYPSFLGIRHHQSSFHLPFSFDKLLVSARF